MGVFGLVFIFSNGFWPYLRTKKRGLQPPATNPYLRLPWQPPALAAAMVDTTADTWLAATLCRRVAADHVLAALSTMAVARAGGRHGSCKQQLVAGG